MKVMFEAGYRHIPKSTTEVPNKLILPKYNYLSEKKSLSWLCPRILEKRQADEEEHTAYLKKRTYDKYKRSQKKEHGFPKTFYPMVDHREQRRIAKEKERDNRQKRQVKALEELLAIEKNKMAMKDREIAELKAIISQSKKSKKPSILIRRKTTLKRYLDEKGIDTHPYNARKEGENMKEAKKRVWNELSDLGGRDFKYTSSDVEGNSTEGQFFANAQIKKLISFD